MVGSIVAFSVFLYYLVIGGSCVFSFHHSWPFNAVQVAEENFWQSCSNVLDVGMAISPVVNKTDTVTAITVLCVGSIILVFTLPPSKFSEFEVESFWHSWWSLLLTLPTGRLCRLVANCSRWSSLFKAGATAKSMCAYYICGWL